MGKALNYDPLARTYAKTRRAVPWIVEPLWNLAARLPPRSAVIELGCGTCNHTVALIERDSPHRHLGVDLSAEMLRMAQARGASVALCQGAVDVAIPLRGASVQLGFCVDVVHHLTDLPRFFLECGRILSPRGALAIVTDSHEDIRRRSLAEFFPEVIPVELERYPTIEELATLADAAGLALEQRLAASGEIDLSDGHADALDQKCSSALRAISDEAHRAGMERVRRAEAAGERWLSRYTVLVFRTR